ncbi:MAG: TIGR02099 family protein [Proteobacteria bacterium]|nr:TIGR02099 family protein [Pseudomonadota bacterium]NOG61351.1 TIGR02099 family protein [Pseudomonadota bacterium]
MLKKFFTILYHFCWYTFAFIVLTAAVLVTVIRMALPEIGGYKNEIQSWVSEYMDYPVVINEITAEWQGWTPHLYLKGIDLYTPDGKSLISKFDSAHLGIDPVASVNKRELVPNQLSIRGLNLEFTRNIDGSISIDNDNNLKTKQDNSALSGWLLKQKHITLEKAKLTWHDKKSNNEPQAFSDVKLELKTQGQRIQVSTYITLPEKHGQSLTMKMDVFGNILTPDWKGKIYAEAKEVKPEHLLAGFPIKSTGGVANAKLWTSWEKSKLIEVSGEVQYSNFSFNTEQYSLPVKNITLNLSGERQQEKDWLLNITLEEMQTEYSSWPVSNFQFNAIKSDSDKSYRYKGYLSYLKFQEIIPLLVASKLIPEETLEKIHWQSLKGELTETNFDFNPESETGDFISFDTNFKDFDLVSHDKKHAIKGLDGSLFANNKLARINLDSKYPEILLSSVFDNPLSLSAIYADLEITNADSIELLINKFAFEDAYISAKSSGKIEFKKESSPFIDIVAHFDETSIENVPYYLPKQTSPDLRKWFTQAMVGGQLLSGDLIFHGHTSDFPFKNSEGNFKTILNIENATINYAEDWPPIDQVTAEVIINNDDLFISSDSAYIFDATVSNFTANIKQLGVDNPHVIVNGSARGHTSDAVNFIKQSPLNENLSLRELTENIYGGINVKLNLDIPLDEEETSVDGVISFSDTTIESKLPGLALEGVNGDVNFTRDTTWASDIDALYHGKPVKLNIPKFDQYQNDSESYIISGTANKDFFITELTTFFPSILGMTNDFGDKLSGESEWSLTLSKSSSATESRQVEFNSDLKGIAIDLPFPIGKKAEETSFIAIKTRLTDLLINEININYDHNIYADFKVDNTKDLIVKNILIGIGQKHPATPLADHISISGELESLNVSDWIDLINLEKEISQTNNVAKKHESVTGNITVKNLLLLGNEFRNININLSNPTDGWQFLFDSEAIKGQTKFIRSDNNRVHANFEKFTLNKSVDNDENKNQISIEKIPELEVNVNTFIYNNNELGQLNLKTSNINNGININNLSIIKPGLSIKATGEWMRIDEVDRSDFHATLEAESIESMLSTFNFDAANIKDGATNIEMNAYWMDTPMNFAMKNIEGELDMKIGKGSFLDINPSAGRLFGLLSLQALPRRLTLDFSDLFNEGFAFDQIEGNFSLQQGHAYTNNLEMTGPSADIIVSGRTGLSTEDYDQIATVTPKISSGLPVASALFGPVGVGVGAVIYIAGELFDAIPKKIDQILSAQYTITGSWDHPNIEKIKEERDSG